MAKIDKRNFIFGAVFAALLAAIITLLFLPVRYAKDETSNLLLRGIVIRALGGAIALLACYVCRGAALLNPLRTNGARSFLWCAPCILVVLVNFPLSALLSGAAAVQKTKLVALFALWCVMVGVLEEFLFRGLLQSVLGEFLCNKKYGEFLTVLITSAVFALWHLFNLLDGAGVGETLLQVGYTFLLGGMFSCIVLRTGSVWFCVLLHAIFDFGGMLVPMLGQGAFQDTCFWALTITFGVLCAAHVLAFLWKRRA